MQIHTDYSHCPPHDDDDDGYGDGDDGDGGDYDDDVDCDDYQSERFSVMS